MENFSQLIVGIAIWGILAYSLANLVFHCKLSAIKKKSLCHSRSSILGEVTEKVVPLLPEFPYHMKDLVFVGKGIDYIVFDGLSRGKLREIVFLEVKSNSSQLNKNEQMIKECLGALSVRYEVVRVNY